MAKLKRFGVIHSFSVATFWEMSACVSTTRATRYFRTTNAMVRFASAMEQMMTFEGVARGMFSIGRNPDHDHNKHKTRADEKILHRAQEHGQIFRTHRISPNFSFRKFVLWLIITLFGMGVHKSCAS